MTDKQIIIEDCPHFIGGCCQEYLDGVCENHKCDLKIIRELEQKLSNKRKECDELHEIVKSQKEEIKNLNYTLYEERNLTTDLAKANLKISALERDLSSIRNRFKNENQQNKEIIKAKEQECERLKKQLIKCDDNIIVDCEYSKKDLCSFIHRKKEVINGLQQQLDQLKAENETYKKMLEDEEVRLTLNEVRTGERHLWFNKAEKLKQTLTEIKEIAEAHKKDESVWNPYRQLDKILQKISEVEND